MKEYRLICNAIQKFDLDLRGKVVLTEAASGHFVWTSIIAAKAGATVYAYTNNSSFGSFEEIKQITTDLANNFISNGSRLHVIDKLTPDIIAQAHIITNSGFLRPINDRILKYAHKHLVVPLMWETWEFRPSDLDLRLCHKLNIPVLGTNESHQFLLTMKYLGLIVKKVLFEHEFEILGYKILIIGDKFGKHIFESIIADNPETFFFTIGETIPQDLIANASVIVVANQSSEDVMIGNNGMIDCNNIIFSQVPFIIHISGKIDIEMLKNNGITYFPEIIAPPFKMSLSTAYVGPKPVIDLHTAGLKVGEIMSRYRTSGHSIVETRKLALRNEICQDFSETQKRVYFDEG